MQLFYRHLQFPYPIQLVLFVFHSAQEQGRGATVTHCACTYFLQEESKVGANGSYGEAEARCDLRALEPSPFPSMWDCVKGVLIVVQEAQLLRTRYAEAWVGLTIGWPLWLYLMVYPLILFLYSVKLINTNVARRIRS